MKKNKEYVCVCKGKIIFEPKKTFAIPDIRHGICEKCLKHYILFNEELKEDLEVKDV